MKNHLQNILSAIQCVLYGTRCKRLLVVLVLITAFSPLAAQPKPRLGILPFTGGAGEDGETIAELFSIVPDIFNTFTVVPRTGAINALMAERSFQNAGYTDSDTIARMGRMLNADYVLSGHIRRLGNRNLLIASIINVETFEQLAGDYTEYRNIEDVQQLLPAIVRKMSAAILRRNTSSLPKLAVAPFRISNRGANVQEAETLAQILSVEIVNTGRYVVLPRTETIQTAMKELEIQMSGATAEEGAKALGRAINAQYVLNAEVQSLGTMKMFTVSILNVEDGSQIAGAYRIYQTIDDGTRLMREIAELLANPQTVGAHTKPRLGILPFVGDNGGDGETIATLFSFQQDILNTYTVVPRTGAVNALIAEQNFQTIGYTDSDTIAHLGRLLNADFVVSGHIRHLGNRNLVITTVVNVETFELIAGDYRTYRNIQDVESLMPTIAKGIISTSKHDTTKLSRLAVAPFHIASADVNPQDAETLAQILSVELVNKGGYAVLPRTSAIQSVLNELNLQSSGVTDTDGVKALGRAVNAQYVLNGQVRRLGRSFMFVVQVLHVEDGSIVDGRAGSRDYQTIENGIELMPELALLLIDRKAADALAAAREKAAMDEEAAEQKRLAEAAEAELKQQMEIQKQKEMEARRIEMSKNLDKWIEASRRDLFSPLFLFMLAEDVDYWDRVWPTVFGRVYGSYTDSNFGISWEALNVNYSFLPFVSFGIGLGGGMTFVDEDIEWNWLGAKAYLGLTVPLYIASSDFSIRLFGDGYIELGYTEWGGLWLEKNSFGINPGYEVGLLLGDYNWGTNFEISYGNTFYRDKQKHSLGLSLRHVPTTYEVGNIFKNIFNEDNADYAHKALIELSFYMEYTSELSAIYIGLPVSFSPTPFISLGVEPRVGFPIELNDETSSSESGMYYGVSIPIGLVIPFNSIVKLYADAILDLGVFGNQKGLIAPWVTPAFETGFLFSFSDFFGFNLKYRGTWYESGYTHSIGITVGIGIVGIIAGIFLGSD